MPTIRETLVESYHLVNPADANPLGILHGGHMMDWLVNAGTLTASRVARGEVVLAFLDDVFFIRPVHVGDMVRIKAWVEYVGKSSMEVGVLAEAGKNSSNFSTATLSYMVFVAVSPRGEPREVATKVEPGRDEALYEAAKNRWLERRAKVADRRAKAEEVTPLAPDSEWKVTSYRIVLSSDTVYGNAMFGGRLLKILDELSDVVASRFAQGVVVTGNVDNMSFYWPMRVGDIVEVTTALNYVGKTSMEIGIKVICEDPYTGRRHHATTSYYTFVHLGSDARPAPVPQYVPKTEDEKKRWEEGKQRSEQRRRRLEEVKEIIEKGVFIMPSN
ncbi:acyl-CoA thioesterase [Sulfodiicoccus acidiphilus]|uniref:Acyl-CoA thioesterase n=1 Tax=Sulfodiicoccus acidiphilus TaxID=1670455 RepID=A0A348B704_9CREN|nr:acyl-CoA thioesterase [Sulfodiicoccus acidiphilus]BBD73956.1 acyl-CoA thioesterase [Sulfodiicoccus acidiphilus]GGU03188.1 acyl-CoA thioesterase [Sulfodiicoccus acidiphilus]